MKRRWHTAKVLSIVCVMLWCFASFCLASSALPVCVSNDGSLLLKTGMNYCRLALVDTAAGEEILVASGRGAGYYAAISPDRKYVCFKVIERGLSGARVYTPMLFNITTSELLALAPASSVAGTPAVSKDGKIAFTVGNNLTVLNANLNPITTLDLGHHVNLIAFSPAGSSIAYNNTDEQIVVMSLDGRKQMMTDGDGSYWNPQFSPSGDKLLVSSVDGRVVSIDLANGGAAMLGRGSNPGWVDDDTVAFTKKTSNGKTVTKTELYLMGADEAKKGAVLINNGDAQVVIGGKNVTIAKGGTMQLGILYPDTAELELLETPILEGKDNVLMDTLDTEGKSETLSNSGSTVVISGVPTIHQVYDTPEWFNGSWACGATAACMALSYYGCFNYWQCWCMQPYAHYSPYGNYIADTYTYNGFTFDIAEFDPDDEYATGGYGYITQNNWEDTKTHMAEYISYHGPSSYVDWSPTFAKACAEVDSSYPHVNLNSLTSAGHYITCIGYYTDQYTLIFNDPYGNKNTPGYPSYDGTEVSYDWPGYNYGNENLNTVHCYIYARYTIQATPTPTPTPIAEIIIDNADPECTLTGTWTESTNVRGWYGTNYVWADMNSGAMATFNLDIPEAGNYDVFAYYTSGTDRSRQAPYMVYYDGGSDTKTFDQKYWGGRFRLMGTYPFQASAYKVELSADTGEHGRPKVVIADAVKAVMPAGQPTPTPTPTPTPSPTPSGKVYVYDITMGSGNAGPNYWATATVWIKNDSDEDVEGATVSGEWSGAVSGTDSDVTGADGKVTFKSAKKRNGGTFTFCVTDVVASGYIYDPDLNNETCDSITVP